MSQGESRDVLRLLQSYAGNLSRRLNRVTVAGDVPFGIDGQNSFSLTGDASHYTAVATVQVAG